MSLSQNPYYSNLGESGGGGGGFISPYGSQNSPGDAAKKSSQHSLRPLTILAMHNAQQAHGEANFTVDGVEIGQVTVVAQVTDPVDPQSTNMLFRIDDGTGRMDARHWLEQHENPDIFAGITEGSYVRVLGTLKQISNKRHLNAPHIRLASAKEFLFHKCEVMLVWAQMTLGSLPGQTGGRSSTVTTDRTSAYMPDGGQPHQIDGSKFGHLPPLELAIIRHMQSAPPRDEGFIITAIVKNLNMGPGISAAEVDAAMLRLMDEGILYTTIDDNHFALTS